MKNGDTEELRDRMEDGGLGTCIVLIQQVLGQLNAVLLVSVRASAGGTVRMAKIL